MRRDERNFFYKVEKRTKNTARRSIACSMPATISKKDREIFVQAVKHRPRIRLAIRQRTRVLERWPKQGVAHARPLHSQDVEAEQRLSRLSKAFRRDRSSRTLFSLGNSGTYLCVLHGLRPPHYVGSARRQ